MPINLISFGTPLVTERVQYLARACGRERDDGLWEGWIEFDGDDGSVLHSARETTQPNFTDLQYWATGLEPVFLEGSLARTLTTGGVPAETLPAPAFEGPAPPRPPTIAHALEAVLDPYSVYSKGGTVLLGEELGALRGWHLRQIIRAYDLADVRTVNIELMSERELIDLIMARVLLDSRRAS